MTVAGLLLAAGEGRRFGGPKALVRDADGVPWVRKRVDALVAGGCTPVLVVLGADADQVAALLPDDVLPVSASDWAQGMGASLRAGLLAVSRIEPRPDAVLVALVDTPGLTPAVVTRLACVSVAPATSVLAQACYDGTPGHPVLIGRDHWDGVASSARGDRGARDYLRARVVQRIECADVGDGRDVDTADQLPAGATACAAAYSDGVTTTHHGPDTSRVTPPARLVVRAIVTTDPLDVAEHARLVADRAAGAVVTFAGVVRDHDQGREVTFIEYVCHPSAAGVVADAAAEVAAQHPVDALAVSHRVGHLEVGECALAVAVSAAHRREAFEAASDLVEVVKHRLPVWKRQVFPDGTDEWANCP